MVQDGIELVFEIPHSNIFPTMDQSYCFPTRIILLAHLHSHPSTPVPWHKATRVDDFDNTIYNFLINPWRKSPKLVVRALSSPGSTSTPIIYRLPTIYLNPISRSHTTVTYRLPTNDSSSKPDLPITHNGNLPPPDERLFV
ncbi:hypothetical protein OUZ56_012483 [Daphnia magna]|uniref:Uncharacterized protein n=1 Tax=Daphnia magna TaxID=35525 RepID=A0ABQ9Z378_9CRUS|nr:hypothetical protein OUZ56_012483 [Daphnia magna]